LYSITEEQNAGPSLLLHDLMLPPQVQKAKKRPDSQFFSFVFNFFFTSQLFFEF